MSDHDLLRSPVLETKLVSGHPKGTRAEWRLVVDDMDTLSSRWLPVHVKPDGSEEIPTWMPFPGSQKLFLECPIYEALYEGNRGPGKTLTLLMDYAKEVGKGYGKSWRGILFRREYKDLDDIVMKIEEWFPKMYPGFRFLRSKAEYQAIWPSGEALLLRQAINEDDFTSYKGHEYPWQGWEELTEWETDKIFLMMQSCSRSSKPGVPTRVRGTTNPDGVGHAWVKKRYKLPGSRGKVIREPGQMPRVAIHGALAENFLMLHNDPGYPTKIKNAASNPSQAKAWLMGSWDITSGGMIDDLWDEKIHQLWTFPAQMIPRGWTITRAYDHGQSHPFVVGWWLESDGTAITLPDGRRVGQVRGDVILWREWYGQKEGEENVGLRMSASLIAQGILDREEDYGVLGRITSGIADTEIWSKDSRGTGLAPKDDMEKKGVFWVQADKSSGSVKRGWEMLRSLLSGAIPNDDGSREEPGLYVCDVCENWLRTVPSTPRDKKNPDVHPASYEDHCGDMSRYRVNWDVPVMTCNNF